METRIKNHLTTLFIAILSLGWLIPFWFALYCLFVAVEGLTLHRMDSFPLTDYGLRSLEVALVWMAAAGTTWIHRLRKLSVF